MKIREIITTGLSIIAMVVSITALCNTLPRMLGLDYLGVVVGILSLLITLLLGWNIYTLIDFKEKANELESIKKDFRQIFEINKATYIKHVAEIEESIATIHAIELGLYKDTNAETELISNLIFSALHHASIGDKNKANVLIHEAIEATKHVDGRKLDKRICFSLSHHVENHKNLGLNEADELIYNLLHLA